MINIVNLILERAAASFIGKQQLNLEPNPSLPPVERHLQSLLLDLINQFGDIALMIDVISPNDGKMDDMWSEAQNNTFSQIISQFTWEHKEIEIR